MHWKVTRPPTPKHGDTKEVTRRAWLPKTVGNIRVWLEQYSTLYVYVITQVPVTADKAVTFGQWQQVSQKPVKWQLAST